MESLDYWRLCDELSVVQAAILIIGEDPSVDAEYILGWQVENRPQGFNAVFAALKHAITSGKVVASIRYECRERGYDEEPRENESIGRGGQRQIIFNHFPDWHLTTVQVDKLKKWLMSRGVKSGFFFPDASEETPDYLSEFSPNYAPKLAAALNAWQHITKNPELLKGKTPKQAIEKWLREHAARLASALVALRTKLLFEGDDLFRMQRPKLLKSDMLLIHQQGCARAINRCIAFARSILQIGEILTLDALVSGVVFRHASALPSK